MLIGCRVRSRRIGMVEVGESVECGGGKRKMERGD